VIKRIDEVVKGGLLQFKGMHVQHYGSYTSGLFTPSGDLDIAIEGRLQLQSGHGNGYPPPLRPAPPRTSSLKDACSCILNTAVGLTPCPSRHIAASPPPPPGHRKQTFEELHPFKEACVSEEPAT